MTTPDRDFLPYYLEELSYLRRAGERFARAYPKVAGRLELQSDECPDPHVERLIEAFAFLTGRIQRNLDDDFPEIAAELLGVLYPHYLNPIPSMAVAQFQYDPARARLTTGFRIEADSPLFTAAQQGAVCRMRTCYPVTLWPIDVVEAAIESPEAFDFASSSVAAVLRLQLVSSSDPFEKLAIDSLRFHLDGEPVLASVLYELLANSVQRVVVVDVEANRARDLPPNCIRPVGFELDEEVIPYPRTSHPAYRLLQEYFTFPEKFHFFDVHGLDAAASGTKIDLVFLLDRVPPARLLLDPDTFSLGCTPVVNLFRKTSEPIRIDHRRLEYRLVPDMRREKTTEIHSVLSVSGIADAGDRSRDYAPFYSFTHAMERREQKAYWHGRRVATEHPDITGSDILLSFRDLDFRASQPADEVVYAQLLCTNRALAEELPSRAILQTDRAMPTQRIVCLKKPTRPINPPLGGQTLWRLVSHLSLNYLGVDGTPDSLKALREILGLYCTSEAPSVQQQLTGIVAMQHGNIVAPVRKADWRGFCRGTQIDLTFKDSHYVGGSAFLFASVLNRFLSLFASVNSFTQLVVRRFGREEEEWKRWPPMAGGKAVL